MHKFLQIYGQGNALQLPVQLDQAQNASVFTTATLCQKRIQHYYYYCPIIADSKDIGVHCMETLHLRVCSIQSHLCAIYRLESTR